MLPCCWALLSGRAATVCLSSVTVYICNMYYMYAKLSNSWIHACNVIESSSHQPSKSVNITGMLLYWVLRLSTEYIFRFSPFMSVLSCHSVLSCLCPCLCLSVCLCILILFFAMSSNCFGVLGDLVTCWCLDALVTLSILFAPSFLLCARYVNGTAGPTHFNFQCLRSKL